MIVHDPGGSGERLEMARLLPLDTSGVISPSGEYLPVLLDARSPRVALHKAGSEQPTICSASSAG
jgi:hypothetical protein